VLSGVAGNGILTEDAVLLGVWGRSVAVPARLDRSKAARVGVTPSSCSGIQSANPVPIPFPLRKLFVFEEAEAPYELDPDPELALIRSPGAGADDDDVDKVLYLPSELDPTLWVLPTRLIPLLLVGKLLDPALSRGEYPNSLISASASYSSTSRRILCEIDRERGCGKHGEECELR
jgi:hypothetical protein